MSGTATWLTRHGAVSELQSGGQNLVPGLNLFLILFCQVASWSMRSWESDHWSREMLCGPDSQGRMDLFFSLEAKSEVPVNDLGFSKESRERHSDERCPTAANPYLTLLVHTLSRSMRPWESAHWPGEVGFGMDSQGRMDWNGSLLAVGEDLVNAGFALTGAFHARC